MDSNPSEAGGHGPNLDPEKSPIKTLSEKKPGTDEIGVSAKGESRDLKKDGDGSEEKEEGFGIGDSVERGSSVIGGESAKKDDSFVAVETNGNKEPDGGLGSIEEKEAVQNPELVEDQNVQIEEQEQLEEGEKTDVMEYDERAHHFFSLQEDRSGFSVGDLVWGKVRSYRWWPGQIFEPKYASNMALKLQKKGRFLVEYFGNKRFAWVPESQLKPFQVHFSVMEKQSSMGPFVNAVDAILEEVSRRVELGMACRCVGDEIYTNLKYKKVENAGIWEGTCSASVDRSMFVNAFQPESLLEYVQVLAQSPCGGLDRLELKIATAQLQAFHSSTGHPKLSVFVSDLGLVENDADIPLAESKVFGKIKADGSTLAASIIKSGKRPRSRPPKNQVFGDNNEQKSLSEQKEVDVDHLAKSTPVASSIKSGKRSRGRPRKNHICEDGSEEREGKKFDYPARASGKKGKVVVSESAVIGRSKTKRFGKEANSETNAPSLTHSRSLKDKDHISLVASQLKESPRFLNSNDETLQNSVAKKNHRKGVGDSSKVTKRNEVEDYSSPSEMLSQLCLVATDPIDQYTFLLTIIAFFTNFRASLAPSSSEDQEPEKSMGRKRGRKKKVASSEPVSSEMSDPDYMQDSYWSHIVLQSSPEREPISTGQKRKGSSEKKGQKKKTKPTEQPLLHAPIGPSLYTEDGQLVGSPNPNDNQEVNAKRTISNIEEKIEEETPTALILSFNESNALPSTAELIKIFSPYGPLRDEETEVLRKTNHAKVVFKYNDDADKAFRSAGKYKVFGPALVSYRLRPLSKSSTASSPEDKKCCFSHKDKLQRIT